MPDEDGPALTREEWQGANARYVAQAMELLRWRLRLARSPSDPAVRAEVAELESAVADAAAPVMTSTEELVSRFGLDAFSTEALLLGVAFEVDGRFSAETDQPHATIGLAIEALPDADWSAFTATAPLRRWTLVEVDDTRALVDASYRVATHVLRHVMGLAPEPPSFPFVLASSASPSAAQIAGRDAVVSRLAERDRQGRVPVVVLHGGDAGDRRARAADVSAPLGRDLHVADVTDLPVDDDALAATLRRWDGRAHLDGAALLVVAEEPLDASDRRRLRAVTAWVTAPLFLSGPTDPPVVPGRTVVRCSVERPTAPERRERWSTVIGEVLDGIGAAPPPDLDLAVARLAEHDRLGLDAIDRIGGQAASALASEDGVGPADVVARMTALTRETRSSGLDSLAERVEPVTGEVLVLPETERGELAELEQHLRWSHRVADEWGMARARSGLSALFAGPSGTGKTLAARTLAEALELDLFRVDLSALVSKYIGDTEKNLRRIFDAARGGGVVLLFDEADALFAKRSEVKESHDRFANSQTAFLLQELETTVVPCVLTTNMRDAIDPAFVRRFRFIVDFPFPDGPSRHHMWETVFPSTVPTRELRP
ncbi:MAG TPA: AAA family ATPase, partial [Iamia sp.]|nr:AAA family ATPase [Iamia sp.]